jgi:hypothetical protein
MVTHSSIPQTAMTSPCCSFAFEPDLSELLRDPMTVALMEADNVDRRELDVLLADTRENLRWHSSN